MRMGISTAVFIAVGILLSGAIAGGESPPATDPVPAKPGEIPPSAYEFVAFDTAPELVEMEDPKYPEKARKNEIQGTVLVRVQVDIEGNVQNSMVIQSVPGLDEAAVTAARSATFKPAMRGEEPVVVWIVMPIEFRLDDQAKKKEQITEKSEP